MNIRSIVWYEMFERKNQLMTSFLAIVLGITAIVSIKNITVFSERAVTRQMDLLGANILILPKSATVQDYYGADMVNDEIPEEYVTQMLMSDLQGLDNLSPKLNVPVVINGKKYTVTGILPKNEFQAKAAWAGAGIFATPNSCAPDKRSLVGIKETQVRSKVINTLATNECLVGCDVAASLILKEGGTVSLFGQDFKIVAVLPETGTVDDSRIFAHLHRIQELAKRGAVINAIEIVGCCNQISGGLVGKLNKLLPDAKVVTISQVVETQINTNKLMAKLSMIFLVIMVLVGGVSIANYMYANVYERRKEIGTMMAMGANSSTIVKMFLLKALVLGVAGGIAGDVLGTGLAVVMGPKIARIPVLPLPWLMVVAICLSVLIAVLASYFPARKAAKIDPCLTIQEI
jgi:putative ABC transport system permease protein